MSWTAEELDCLKSLAEQGLSAGQIASHLPGKSRNAVIGMLKRGKGAYGSLQGKPRNNARGRTAPPAEIKLDRPALPPRARIIAPPPIAPAVIQPKPEPVANLPAPLPITFLQAIMTDRCLHYACAPFDPDGPDMPVCGAERATDPIGTRYCRRHLTLRVRVAA
ncbi:GcrA family cell cycle regulator [Mesorhizobium sp. CA4]|uniref:GcrA family cell cycle regulator n=1 Tax=Mesorhizobium sp. CA4 TaxID=588499 RepID=UPI001CD12420|nr:GcrA family cell cycle regulator [Mesorhizobium sp. CA4]MBZ9822317.1 GcrA family cell cycle regulator [Mesorhizobium sp. CA4]